jgi:colanic acid/amylovoran biosynthesis glycosyltransferase
VNRLHLLEVGVRWPPETFLGWKLEGLAARGMRVTVASRSILDPAATLPGVTLVELPPAGRRFSRRALLRDAAKMLLTSPGRLLRMLRRIGRMDRGYRRRYGGILGLLALYLPVARLRPDVVHFEWSGAAVLYLPMYEIWGSPVVASCHGSDLTLYPHVPGHEHVSSRLPELFRSASAVHCVSESLRAATANGYGVGPHRARVIRQGVDPDLFRPANGTMPRDSAAFNVTSIAWLRWMKGLEWALVAIRTLVTRGVPVRLEVIGGDPSEDAGERGERERIRHTVADLGLEEHVRLTGTVPSEEVVRRLQASDALLLPSLDEGLPTVVLEAMACGTPVVATDCGGVREAVTDGVEGFVVQPRDAEGLAQALERLWREPELRERMGDAGRRTATSRFTLKRQLDEFLALYTEVARA